MNLPRRFWSFLRRHADVQTVVGIVVAGSLIGYVISIGVAPRSGGQFWAIVRSAWWLVLLLTIPYLALRFFVWVRLLDEVGIHIRRGPLLAAFAGGEMAKVLPAGVYVENYLLSRGAHLHEFDTIRSTVATTATLGLESLIAVPALLILGIPGFYWLRWTVIGIVAGWLLVIGILWVAVRLSRRLRVKGPGWLRRARRYTRETFAAAGDLLTWRTVLAVLPTALYLLIYAIDLRAVAHAAGVHHLSLVDAIAVYAFIVLTVILVPIPTELGLTEFSGLSALIAFGADTQTAAIVMLGLRALVTGCTILACAIILLLLRHELSPPANNATS